MEWAIKLKSDIIETGPAPDLSNYKKTRPYAYCLNKGCEKYPDQIGKWIREARLDENICPRCKNALFWKRSVHPDPGKITTTEALDHRKDRSR